MISQKDMQNMKTALTQWKQLVERYEDVDTKNNAGTCIIFGEPFFAKDANGVYIRSESSGNIQIMAECLGCNKLYSANNTNLSKHKKCEESKEKYATYVETRKAEPKIVVKEDMQKEITMLKEELKKVKAEKDEMEKALKIEIHELRHENEILRRKNDCFQHEMLKRSGTPYPLYDVPNKRPGLVKVYQMMFKNKSDEGLMKIWMHHTEELKEVFQSFDFVVEDEKVESVEELSKQVDALVRTETSKLSQYQSIFVFVLCHGSYDRIADERKGIFQIQTLRKSLTECSFLLNKPKVLVFDACQHFKAQSSKVDPNVLTPTGNCLDLLEIRSSSPGQESFIVEGNVDKNADEDPYPLLEIGSFFIRNLIDALKCNSTLGLSQLMFLVQNTMNELNINAQKSTGLNRYHQTPELRSTLRGDIFFRSS